VCCKSQQGRAGDQSQDIRQKKRLESLRIGDINCLLQARLAYRNSNGSRARKREVKSLSTDAIVVLATTPIGYIAYICSFLAGKFKEQIRLKIQRIMSGLVNLATNLLLPILHIP